MNYSSGYEHHQQEQQQNAYDPSYDQSYYGYNQQYAYYPSQYTSSYAQQTHQQFQQEPTSIHPPGVPIPAEAVHSQTQLQNQQNVHFLSGVVENQQQLNSAAAVSVNPAAVAALSQLSHLRGNMDVAQGTVNMPIGQSQYRGGRRFRGRGRGQFHHRGRGRGRSGSSHFLTHTSGPTISNAVSEQAAAGNTSVVQSSSVPGQSLLPMPLPPPRKAWCEICKVDCNTAEILEQHKNGKRHNKNLRVHEELQRRKAINGQQSGHMPTSELHLAGQPEKNSLPPENVSSGAPNNDHKNEIEQQKDTGETYTVLNEEKPRDDLAVVGRGSKRKKRGGRGDKYMRANDGPRRPVEAPLAKQPILFICELCNVKCESQVVLDSHLTGKKHLSNLKRVHGLQTSNGGGPQALYPPPLDIYAISNSINQQVQQGATDPQLLLAQVLMNYVVSQTQVPATVPPPEHVPTQAPASSTPEVSQHVLESERENHTGETKTELLSVPAQLDVPESSGTKTQTADPESQVKEVNLTQDNSVTALPDNPDAVNDQIPSQ